MNTLSKKEMTQVNEWKDAERPAILDSGTITGLALIMLFWPVLGLLKKLSRD